MPYLVEIFSDLLRKQKKIVIIQAKIFLYEGAKSMTALTRKYSIQLFLFKHFIIVLSVDWATLLICCVRDIYIMPNNLYCKLVKNIQKSRL